MEWLKYKNLNILKKKQLFYKIKTFLTFASDDTFWGLIILKVTSSASKLFFATLQTLILLKGFIFLKYSYQISCFQIAYVFFYSCSYSENLGSTAISPTTFKVSFLDSDLALKKYASNAIIWNKYLIYNLLRTFLFDMTQFLKYCKNSNRCLASFKPPHPISTPRNFQKLNKHLFLLSVCIQ